MKASLNTFLQKDLKNTVSAILSLFFLNNFALILFLLYYFDFYSSNTFN